MARRQVRIGPLTISWGREPETYSRVSISYTLSLDLIRESPETAARMAEFNARRAVMNIARVLKTTEGRYVIP